MDDYIYTPYMLDITANAVYPTGALMSKERYYIAHATSA
jgi:hypothetical protein